MQNKLNRVHLIAIGGAVMHNLALALKAKGLVVTGSDDEIFDPALSKLKEAGLAPAQLGWSAGHISKDLDAVIVGMHAKPDNVELSKAQELGIPVFSFPDFVYQQSKQKQRVVIAGSHGKTTITAMVMHVLKAAGKDFDYLVGSTVKGFDLTVKLTNSAPIIVIEGDEYLTSPLDPTPKFLKYKHHIAVVSGIAWDHVNVFKTEEVYVRQFDHLADASPKAGILIYNEEDIIASVICKKEREDVTSVEYKTPKHEIKDGVTFLIEGSNKYPLRVFGKHNLSNISAAYSVCTRIGVTKEAFFSAIQTFEGAAGRLQLLGTKNGYSVFKDFAHSPSKVVATTEAVKKQFGSVKVTACLELHTFSSLTKSFLTQYKNALKSADFAAVYYNPEVLAHKNQEPLDAGYIIEAFGRKDLEVFTSTSELASYLSKRQSESTLLLMSSGHFGGIDIKSLVS